MNVNVCDSMIMISPVCPTFVLLYFLFLHKFEMSLKLILNNDDVVDGKIPMRCDDLSIKNAKSPAHCQHCLF